MVVDRLTGQRGIEHFADENSTCHLARRAGAALVARASNEGLLRDDIGIDDVLDMAAAIAWVGEQPQRDAAQRGRLLNVVMDGLRTPT